MQNAAAASSIPQRSFSAGPPAAGSGPLPARPRAPGIALVLAALAAGIAGDALLRAGPMGINVALWAAVLAALLFALARGQAVVSRFDDALGAGLLLLFAAGFAWRTDPWLLFLNLCGLGTVIALAALRRPARRLAASGLLDYIKGAVLTAIYLAAGPPLLVFRDTDWTPAHGASRRLLVALRGALLAFPFLLLFGALLMGADPVFQHLIRARLHINLPTLISHTFLILFFAWLAGGFYHGTFHYDPERLRLPARPEGFGMDAAEIGTALGLLDALFLIFMSVQFRYLYGGAQRVMVTPGLTYADYARRGFFELTAVVALALPLLLGTHWLLRRGGGEPAAGRPRAYLLPAAAMVALVFAILVSALYRMHLYQQAYGLTELRVYTMAFMLWLGVVLGWFAGTVLRGQKRRFAGGVLATGLAAIMALEIINPAGLIARVDLQRAIQGRKADPYYVAWLGPDAVPAIVSELPRLARPAQCAMLEGFNYALKNDLRPPRDWRTWNWSRWEGRRLAEAAVAAGKRTPCPNPNAENSQ